MSSRSPAGRGLAAVLLALLILSSRSARATSGFTTGDLVVYRVGDGGTTPVATGNKVFLDEYAPGGTLVQSIELPSNDSLGPNLVAGSSNSEGLFTRSSDGRYLVFAGYSTTLPGPGDLSNTSSIPRRIGRIDAAGNLDLSTTYAGSDLAGEPRGATSVDGSGFWLTTGAGGVNYLPLGSSPPAAPTQIATAPAAGVRGVGVFNGQLYASAVPSSTPRLGTVGSGAPTTNGQTTTAIPGNPSGNFDGFIFLDLDAGVSGVDTLYVADEVGSAVRKYCLIAGSWVSKGSISPSAPATGQLLRGLVGAANGTTVTLYATSGTGSGAPNSRLLTFTDTLGYSASSIPAGSTFSLVVNAPTNTAFRGVAFAPDASTAVRLRSFEAHRSLGGGTDLSWSTGFEAGNLGFNLYRVENGERVQVNGALFPGSALAGVGQVGEGTYAFHDAVAGAAYVLEDVDLSGARTPHGPYYPAAFSRAPLTRVPEQRRRAVAPGPLHREFVPSGTPDRGITSETLAAGPWLKVGVREEGVYAISGAELVAAGLPERAEVRSLRLFTEGREVALEVEGAAAGPVRPESRILFYGLGLDTRDTDTRTYWLTWAGPPGKRVGAASPLRRPAPGPASFPYALEARERLLYFATLQNGPAENFFGLPVTAEGSSQTFQVDGLSGSGGKLEVSLQGVTALAPRPDHDVIVSCNGQPLGHVMWDGPTKGQATFALPAGLLLEGENTVDLRSQGPAPDVSLVDSIRLTYPRGYNASSGALRFTAPAGARIGIHGPPSGGRVWDVTDAQAPLAVGELAPGDGNLDIPGRLGQARLLLAFSEGSLRVPVFLRRNAPSHWSAAGHRADLLVLTPGELAHSLVPLQKARTAEGLPTQIIDLEDVYDEVNWGHPSAEALRRFLSRAHSRWEKRPRYVLLVGDATYDPRDYLGFGPVLGVPSAPVDAGGLETASDDALADFDGDGVPELTVGRIPVRSAPECSALVERILAGTPATGAGLFISDLPDSYPFQTAAERASAAFGGSGVLLPRTGYGADDRSTLFGALAKQPAVVSYSGHGSIDFWRGDLLTTSDLAGPPLETGAVWCLMTCLNGYFTSPSLPCLGEGLVRSRAAAVWASSGYCTPAVQDRAQQAFLQALAQGERLGDAARSAKRLTIDRDLRLTWILFGDPTRRLR